MRRFLSIWASLLLFLSVSGVVCLGEGRGVPTDKSELSRDAVTGCSEAKALLATVSGFQAAPVGTLKLQIGRKELFLDNYVVARLENVKRQLHPPQKYGPVIRPDQPWEGGGLQIRSGPAWSREEKIWKLWYLGGGSEAVILYATSDDGLHWSKPLLNRVMAGGSKQNNAITADPTLKWPENAMLNIIYDPDDADPQRRYKGFLGAFGRKPIVSAEGVDWHRLNVPKIESSDESHLFRDPVSRLYVATVKHGGPYGRSVYVSVSKDFERWTDPRDCLIFHADKRDQELGAERVQMHLRNPALRQPTFNRPEEYKTDIYNLPVFAYEGLYVGLPTVFNHSGNTKDNSDGFSMVELAASRDLIHWERVGKREKFIPLSPLEDGKNYDVAQLLAANRPIVKDGEIWFYYTGLKWRAHPSYLKSGKSDPQPDAGAICLAKLRLDGFVSLDAGETEGYVVTKPLMLGGKSLHVNLSAPDGDLRVEVLDAEGRKTLAGYSLKDSVPAKGDGLDMELKWKTQPNLSALAGKSVRLRFALRKASLYAFWVN